MRRKNVFCHRLQLKNKFLRIRNDKIDKYPLFVALFSHVESCGGGRDPQHAHCRYVITVSIQAPVWAGES